MTPIEQTARWVVIGALFVTVLIMAACAQYAWPFGGFERAFAMTGFGLASASFILSIFLLF